jgi:sugar phosphate isomerase/epimerase
MSAIMGKMKFGICEWACPLDGPYACKIAAQLGLDGIELDLGGYERNFPLANNVIQEAYREAGKTWGIEFSAIAVNALCRHGMNNSSESKEGKIARLAIRKGIEAADALGLPLVQLPSFEDGAIRTAEDMDSLAENLRYACDLAAEKGILIGMENVLSIDENRMILQRVGKSNLKIYFDMQNYFLNRGYDSVVMLEALAQDIIEFHAKDGNVGELSGALLGTGDSRFYEQVEVIKKIQYSGWIHLENFYDQQPLSTTGDPFELLKKDITILKEAFA